MSHGPRKAKGGDIDSNTAVISVETESKKDPFANIFSSD